MAENLTSDGAIGKQNTSRTIPLSTVLQTRHITFPFIADVFNVNQLPAYTNIKEGELLWFLSRSTENGQPESVLCCRWSDPQNMLEIGEDWGVNLRLKNHWISTRSRLTSRSVGPTLSVHSVVNLAKPNEPIFAVPADNSDNKYAFLKKDNSRGGGDWRGRLLVLGKDERQGYLAKGTMRNLVIPKDFKDKFLFDDNSMKVSGLNGYARSRSIYLDHSIINSQYK